MLTGSASSFSIIGAMSSEGVVGSKRATGSPRRSQRKRVKFHLTAASGSYARRASRAGARVSESSMTSDRNRSARTYRVGRRVLQVGPERVRGLAVDVALCEELAREPVLTHGEVMYLLRRAGLLAPELVAREGQDLEALRVVRFVQLRQLRVLALGQASLARDVDHDEHLAAEARQRHQLVAQQPLRARRLHAVQLAARRRDLAQRRRHAIQQAHGSRSPPRSSLSSSSSSSSVEIIKNN